MSELEMLCQYYKPFFVATTVVRIKVAAAAKAMSK